MDDIAGALAAFVEALAGLIGLLVELLLLAVEFAVLLIESAIWGLAALFGKSRSRPQRRHFNRPALMKGNSRRMLSYLLLFGGTGLFFGGRAVYHHYFTAEIILRGAIGLQIPAVDVEWVSQSGKTKKESIESPARYLKHRWDELRIIDEDYLLQTIELTKHPQDVQLRSRMIEKLKEDSIDKFGEVAGEALGKTHEKIASEKVSKFLSEKLSEHLKRKDFEKEP